MTRPIHVITMAEALPEHAAEVWQILTRTVELARQKEGCLRMDLYRDSRRPLLLNTIECWESLDAHRRHLDSPLISSAVMALLGKMKGLPDIRVLDALSEFSA